MHACRSTLEDPTLAVAENGGIAPPPVERSPAPPTTATTTTPSTSVSTAGSATPAPAAPQAKLGTDGTYVAEGGNYRVEAKFEQGKITITEPNKVAVYEQRGDSRVYRYFDAVLGAEFFLEIAADGQSLVAFKTSTSAKGTKLTLVSPSSRDACKAGLVEIPVQNDAAINPKRERLWGTRDPNPINAIGEYATEGTHPFIRLEKDGTGLFELHGAPKPEYQQEVKEWWLQANCDGTLISTTYPAATVYWIILHFRDGARPGHPFARYGLQVGGGRMVILDRVKK